MAELTNGAAARAYQALRESEELHRLTLSAISDAVFLTDDEGAFTFICPNVDTIFGYVPDEVQAMGRINRLLGENVFDRAELAARGEIRNIERDVVSKSGEHRALLIHLKQVSIQSSTVLYSCRDVTERKHAEDELRSTRLDLVHASRLALLGELMASIAHEINQPLTAILANASAGLLLLDNPTALDGVEALREILGDVHERARLAGDTIARLRSLAGKRPLERQPLNVNEVVTDILRFVGGDARRRGVILRTEMRPTLPLIAADRVSLQQVVLNLVLNAMDAMDHLEQVDRELVIRTQHAGDAVEIAVIDRGHGIPSDRLPRLFDAFFTTKRDGLGLGLPIARSIVEAHGGRIWAEDLGGRGASFRLNLPVR
ncbi:MAG TPA: ATP-binding protein [Methylomirabilota bacterium]|jgi:PAS domain S-box-containing protein